MDRSHLGCLSSSGLFAALFSLFLISVVWTWQGGRMFNPGALNAQAGTAALGGVNSHADLAGECAACHAAPWSREGMAGRCLDCHSDVLDEPQDFHTVMLAESGGKNCTRCHTDHNGPNAPLTVAGLDNFPHDALGFSLAAHRNQPDGSLFACADCHSDEDWDFEPLICTACHSNLDPVNMQTHLEDFGEACLACHDGVDRFSGFDHARVSFQLEGRHAGLGCAACHLGARSPAELGAAPQDCASCHAEPQYHLGLLGTDCAACHTSTAWTPAEFGQPHTFPIAHGEQGASSCRTCHPDSLQAYTCYGCHEHNPAEIEEEHREEGIQDFADCVLCHPTGLEEEGEERHEGGEHGGEDD